MQASAGAVVQRPSAEDALLIQDLYARYTWSLDTGDTEGYVRLFTDDAVVVEERPEGPRDAVGHEAIRELVLRFHANPEFPGHQHHAGSMLIEPDPEGRADHRRVRCYVLTTHTQGTGHDVHVYWCGHTSDIVAKVGDGWLIKRREIHPWAGDVLSGFPRLTARSRERLGAS